MWARRQVRGDGEIRSTGLATRGMAGEKEAVTMVIARFLSLVNGKHVLHSLKRGTWERKFTHSPNICVLFSRLSEDFKPGTQHLRHAEKTV